MNSEYDKIDDIFRKALEGAVEQPSSGLWRKISGRLLWKEITQFNFTNLSAGWTAGAAAGVIVASLLIFNFVPSTTENVARQITTDKTPENRNNTNPDKQTQTFSSNENIGQHENNKASAAGAAFDKGTTALENQNQGNNASENIVPDKVNSNPDQNTLIGEVSTQKTALSETKITGLNKKTEQPKSSAALAAAEALPISKPKEAGIDEVVSTNSGDNSIAEQKHEAFEISQIEARKGLIDQENNRTGISEIPNPGDGLILTGEETPNNLERRSSGKIQKMHSLSFTLGQFFKGKYNPPKRDLDELNSARYRGKNHVIAMSAYLAPEMIKYTRTASTSREQNYIGGFAINYISSNYMLEGGFELSFSNDLGDYMVNMQTFDSTGYYNHVGSFTIDPENPDSIIFNTVPVAVMDSVEHKSLQQTQNQYTYLQFPFMIGYKAFQKGLFSAYIKAGPSFSVLLNRKEPTLNYYNPDATVQNVDNYTPTRTNTSIQILVSLCLHYQASENFGILIEPTYRYYLRSVYDAQGGELKNPFGIGIRGGMFYNF